MTISSETTTASPIAKSATATPAIAKSATTSAAAITSPTPTAHAGLVAQDGGLAAVRTAAAAAGGHILEHGRVLKHVGQNEEADLAAAHIDVLQLGHPPVSEIET